MFKDILTIGGKPGLFRIVSNSKNYVIVESLIDGKKSPSYSNEKVSLLRDIVMYGEAEEKRLNEIFKSAYELENGGKISVDTKDTNALQEYFGKVFPEFDRERIYPNDIKKFVNWYNLLIDSNITNFDIEEAATDEATVDEAEKTEKKPEMQQVVKNTATKVSTKSAAAKQPSRVAMKRGS